MGPSRLLPREDSEKTAVYEPESRLSLGTMILDFPASTNMRNKFLLVYKLPSLRYFVIAAQTVQDIDFILLTLIL